MARMRVELDGIGFNIDQLPAKDALRCALVAGKWRGMILSRAGAAETGLAASGAALAAFCEMLLAQEYVDACFLPLLSVCSYDDGQPVTATWQVRFTGDALGTLLKLHKAALQHSCGAFLAGLAGAMTDATQPPPTTAT